MMVSVTLDGIRKSFGAHEVLKDISLEIADKAFVAFVGPSGCGKSTLLRVIAGLEAVNAGEIRFGARRMNEVPAPDRGAAMVFQSYALYPHMSVWENMSFSLRLRGVGRAERRARAAEVAAMLQLDELLDRKPGQLSGGQRQRVAIGRALMRQPEVFLFDEPLSNLDAALRAEMRVELAKLHQSLGSTMIYVTHDQIEAMTMADTIVVLKDGRIMQMGAPMELYSRPASQFVAEFIGAPRINIFAGQVAASDAAASDAATTAVALDGGATVAIPAHRAAAGAPVRLGVRPENVALVSGEDGIAAKVDVVEHLGAETLVYCTSAALPAPVLVKTGHTAIAPGAAVRLAFDGAACHLFDGDGQRIAAAG
ncbi:ABC transporter ATP-binding protein [Aquibium sp. A9E412]|uniref:ABC transporter ATP-binding protein n=1 Tax=Aquibium sp. A9E412 TaxID=2976767 RepID=UPI0025AFD1FE|nr:ABC transporter ATP-binding protein [Aquibium sp. A9E412]MDN2566951.1 ABC transporter ATP-binding protein [Aquibium sp. A9E412]